MLGDAQSWLAWPIVAAFIAMPAAGAWRRRRVNREVSAVADGLSNFAASLRDGQRWVPMEDTLRARVLELGMADAAAFHLAHELERGGSAVLADAAQRLALRLKRRVCFERKMLARTAPGLRRGAIAASLPPLLMWLSHYTGADIPQAAQLALLGVEAAGCWLLWRLARVEI